MEIMDLNARDSRRFARELQKEAQILRFMADQGIMFPTDHVDRMIEERNAESVAYMLQAVRKGGRR